MLDSDTCVYAMTGRHGVRERLLSMSREQVFLSTVVIAELMVGAEKSAQRERNFTVLQEFTDAMMVLPFEYGDAKAYAMVRAHLERAGTPIGAMDTLIGAHSLSRGMTLVTNNAREFSRIPNLVIDNWASA